MTAFRIGYRRVAVYVIDVDYCPQEDQYVISPLEKGKLVWKPF